MAYIGDGAYGPKENDVWMVWKHPETGNVQVQVGYAATALHYGFIAWEWTLTKEGTFTKTSDFFPDHRSAWRAFLLSLQWLPCQIYPVAKTKELGTFIYLPPEDRWCLDSALSLFKVGDLDLAAIMEDVRNGG